MGSTTLVSKELRMLRLAVVCCALGLAMSGPNHKHNYMDEHLVDVRSRLMRDLFRDYDKDVIPQMDADTPVPLSLALKAYRMDLNDKGELDFTAWMVFDWEEKLWIPDYQVYNAVEYGQDSFSGIYNSRQGYAIVYNTGKVLYIPPLNGKVLCKDQDFANWPWGEYDCNIKLGSWVYSANQIKLSTYNGQNGIENGDFDENSPSFITANSFSEESLESKYYECCPDEAYESMNYRFKVQRRWHMGADGKETTPSPAAAYESKKLF